MKKIIENIIRIRNKNFHLHEDVSAYVLLSFAIFQMMSVLRGYLLLLRFRAPKLMLLERGVRFFNLPSIQFGRCLKIGEQAYLSALGKGKISLGNNVSIGAFSRIIISTTLNNPGEFITIGNNVGFGEFSYIGGAGGVMLGDDCIIGQYFSCHPENHTIKENELVRLQPTTRKGIVIGKNCWIGSKVTILDGVIIGDNCVIAAGAVVNKCFPANSIIGGVPAKLLENKNEKTKISSNLSSIIRA